MKRALDPDDCDEERQRRGRAPVPFHHRDAEGTYLRNPRRPRTSAPGVARDELAGARDRQFTARPPSKFSGLFPYFRRPSELGHFSLELDRSFKNDRRHLKRYFPPPGGSTDRLHFNLRDGYDTFQKRDENVQTRLTNVMNWILSNKRKFHRSRANVQYSAHPASARPSNQDLLQSLGVDFVAWRGHFTKFLCTPYERQEGWQMAATLFRGTIYISEVETEQSRARRLGMGHFEQMCMYGGYKFEQYVTSEDGRKPPNTQLPVNNLEAYCTVVRSELGHYKLLYSGEVDCCRAHSDLRLPQDYVELKTSRRWFTQKNEDNFYRYKLLKWWAQSFLVGIPEVICGFRDDNGIVSELKGFKTMEMPSKAKGAWDGTVCFNFLHQLLTFIKSVVVVDDPSAVYLFDYKADEGLVSYTEHREEEHRFVPEWFTKAFADINESSSADAKCASKT